MTARAADVVVPRARYRPTRTLAGSIGLHCAAGVGALFGPETWPWAIGVVAANHTFLGAVGLWPRSTLLGPNLSRLPAAAIARGEVAITFDDGPDPGTTPRVLELLEAYGARASFFCIAEKAAAQRALCREIVSRGHGIENHSLRHSHTFAMMGMGGFRREIAAAQSLLVEACGREPHFFRAPAGLRNPLLEPVLHGLGLTLVSWTRRGFDTRSADAAEVAARLTGELSAGDILVLHDGGAAPTREGVPVVLEALPLVLEAIARKGLRAVTLHQALEA